MRFTMVTGKLWPTSGTKTPTIGRAWLRPSGCRPAERAGEVPLFVSPAEEVDDGSDDAAVVGHEAVEDDGNGSVSGTSQSSARGRDDHQVEWVPQRRCFDPVPFVFVGREVVQEIASRAHLSCARRGPQIRVPRPVVRTGDRDVSTCERGAATALDPEATRERSHAETHDIDWLAVRRKGLRLVIDLRGELRDRGCSPRGRKIDRTHAPAPVLSERASDRPHLVTAMPYPMQQENGRWVGVEPSRPMHD